MVQANELKIGNIVSLILADGKRKTVKVEAITGTMVSVSGLEANRYTPFKLNQIEAIPLTDDILLKCGFDRWQSGIYKLGDFYFYRFEHVIRFRGNSKLCDIKYLHQLQNLYFALTGQELTINL